MHDLLVLASHLTLYPPQRCNWGNMLKFSECCAQKFLATYEPHMFLELQSDAWCLYHAERFLLGLCEGNFCSGGRHGRTKGNGRIVRPPTACGHLSIVLCSEQSPSCLARTC